MATLRSAFGADEEQDRRQADHMERLAERVSPNLANSYRDSAAKWRRRSSGTALDVTEPATNKE